MVIWHDRWFLDRTGTHILALEGDDDNEPNGSGSRATSRAMRKTKWNDLLSMLHVPAPGPSAAG